MRASAHALSGQVLRHKTRRSVFPDGLRGDQDDRLLQLCPARGHHGTRNVLPGVAPAAEELWQGFDGEGVEAFAYMGDVSLGLEGITTNTVKAFAFLQRELEYIGLVADAAETVALRPKGHALTVEEISLLDSIEVRIADNGGVTGRPDRPGRIRAGARKGGREGWGRGPPCALPR